MSKLTAPLFLALLLVAAPTARAQTGIELSVFGGLQFGGEVDVEDTTAGLDGDIDLEPGPSYGAMLGYRVRKNQIIVLSYHRQQTDALVAFDGGGALASDFDTDIGFLQFGGEVDVPVTEHFVPFYGITLGAAHFSPDVTGVGDDWYFAGHGYVGVKVPITERIGIRTQLGMVATVIDDDSQFVCVSAGGLTCLVSSDITALLQGNLSAGLYIRF